MPQVPMIPSFSERTMPKARSSAASEGARRRKARWLGAAAFATTAAALVLAPESVRAQEAKPVSPDGKAIVGTALLGAEVVDLTMGIIGVNAGWPYLVFGALGAGGGAVGGYFIEQETRDAPEVSLYLLAGGMALVIPTIVVSLNATTYKPPESTMGTSGEPADNQPSPGPAPLPAQPQSRAVPKPQRFGFSLVGMREGELALSLPGVAVKPLYTRREMWTYGVAQGTEVNVPLFQASF